MLAQHLLPDIFNSGMGPGNIPYTAFVGVGKAGVLLVETGGTVLGRLFCGT